MTPILNTENRLPYRVLLLLIIAFALLTIFAAVNFDKILLLILPAVLVVGILFIKIPEIALGAFIVGQNLWGIVATHVGIEQPSLIYMFIGMSAILAVGLIILHKKAALPNKINPIIIAVILVLIVFFFNVHRTQFPHYTLLKSCVFLAGCITPFVFLQFLSGKTEIIEKSLKYALFIGTIPLFYSFLQFFITGVLGQTSRFNAIELVHVNQFARNLGYISVIAIWQYFQTKKNTGRLSSIAFLAASILIIIMTGSRGSLLATMGAIIIFIIAFSEMSGRKKVLYFAIAMFTALIPMVLGLGTMLRRLYSLQYMDLSLAGRLAMWKAAWEHRFDHVIFGIGTGNFASILPAWAVAAGLRHPHNLVVEFYIEWGIIGLFILAILFLCPVLVWFRIFKSDDYSTKTKSIANLMITLVAFSSVNALSNSSVSDPQLFLTLGILSSLLGSLKSRGEVTPLCT